MAVVVRDVLVQDRPQMPRVGDQHPVSALSLDGPYPAPGTVTTSTPMNSVASTLHTYLPSLAN